jgi:hypothetical protein
MLQDFFQLFFEDVSNNRYSNAVGAVDTMPDKESSQF